MEPLSTLALVAAFLAPVPLTRRPDFSAGYSGESRHVFIGEATETVVSVEAGATESLVLVPGAQKVVDRVDQLRRELQLYQGLSDGWDGEGSLQPHHTSIDAAQRFVGMLPSGLPLPRPMLSNAGEVGFYWDLTGGFADISFDANGLASFFSRTHVGVELYRDGIRSEVFTRDWFFQLLGEMAAPAKMAA